MSSLCARALVLLLAAGGARAEWVLRVCADPDNLPYSNRAGEGLENRIADLLAADLNARLEYFWATHGKSFVEHTLGDGRCDMIMGIPSGVASALTTRPYYTSSYVFVSRQDRNLDITSLFDQRLTALRIGIQIAGDGYTPPAVALTGRQLIGFPLNPASRMIEAVERGDIDIAVAWGPVAGYLAARQRLPLDVAPVAPRFFNGVPFTYSIAAGVREDRPDLRDQIDAALVRQCVAIRKILIDYRVPGDVEGASQCEGSQPLRSALSR